MTHAAPVAQIPKRIISAVFALALLLALIPQLVAPAAASIADAVGRKVESGLLAKADSSSADVRVIIGKTAPDPSVEASVVRSGGRITEQLPIINGFAAELPASAISEIARNVNVRSISSNRVGRFETLEYTADTIASNAPKSTSATTLWNQGNLGEGVGVALIDTGVSPMNDFVASGGRLIHGPDLSGEFSTIDTFGHGTAMAGIIGGDGYDSAHRAEGMYAGLAPKAWIVSVKVAGRNGATDVSTVLAAMHWVAAYRDQFNIRVVNLAWGTEGTQGYKLDPLNYAVERLWRLGITVVTAAGNSGPGPGTILKPADDPFVITVGAYDDKGDLELANDSVPDWSSRGPTPADGIAKPDIVAPGRKIISPRSYGSTIEQDNPKALIAPSYIRGSGTSQAAAVTSGAAALLIRQKPHLAPDQVKYLLTRTATPIRNTPYLEQGAGRLNIAAAASAYEGYANTYVEPALGLGSLEASRGGRHIETDCNGDGTPEVIRGEITVQCEEWNGESWTGGSWTGASWTGDSWTGAQWTGTSWTGGIYRGGSWTGSSWTAGSWTIGSWASPTMRGGSWTGGSWSGAQWTGASWSGGIWRGGSWTSGSWTGGIMRGGSWTSGSWTSSSWSVGTLRGGSWTGGSWTGPFLTAWWGEKPKSNQRVAGEPSEKPAD